MLRAVAKHSAELAQAVVSCGGVASLVLYMEDLDIGVKEAAAWALSCIARHSECKDTHRGMRSSPFSVFLHPPPSHSQRWLIRWWMPVPSLCCCCVSGSPG